MLCRSPVSLTIRKVIIFTKKFNTYKLNLNEWFIQLEAYSCYHAKSNYPPNLEPNPSLPPCSPQQSGPSPPFTFPPTRKCIWSKHKHLF